MEEKGGRERRKDKGVGVGEKAPAWESCPLCSIAFPEGFVPGTAKIKLLYSTPVGHTLSPTKKPMKREQLWSSPGVTEGSDRAKVKALSCAASHWELSSSSNFPSRVLPEGYLPSTSAKYIACNTEGGRELGGTGHGQHTSVRA